MENKSEKIAVVGLGYVGLPLAIYLAEAGWEVFGYDVVEKKIQELSYGVESMGEIDTARLQNAYLHFTSDPKILEDCSFIIVTVPTPIDKAKRPDLCMIETASKTIGEHLQSGTVIVYESTVYPGVTEEIALPILQKTSGLIYKKDFFIGYSPERINPGDTEHTLDKVIKIISADTEESLSRVEKVYGSICKAGLHKASSIKVAEAAKVIENTQRDLNIALMNELSLIFHRIGINTREVIEAAGTKWNFHKYYPGLVGGHCIGVDPYYLVHKAEELGYHPEVITAGRRINDWMPEYVADLMIRGLVEAGKVVQGAKVLVMGLTFKEDVRDCRNSKIKYTIKKLVSYGVDVIGYDPYLSREEVESFGVKYESELKPNNVDGVIIATLHREFKKQKFDEIIEIFKEKDTRFFGTIVDIKSYFFNEVKKYPALIYKFL